MQVHCRVTGAMWSELFGWMQPLWAPLNTDLPCPIMKKN
jgi:hypothetical protein